MSRLASLFLALVLSCLSSAYAQSGPAQLEGPAGKSASIMTYADSDGKTRGRKLLVADLAFPIRVFEETPTGMVRIRHADEDYWVAIEDFKVKRAVVADCNIISERVTTGAARGANEGCAGVKRK